MLLIVTLESAWPGNEDNAGTCMARLMLLETDSGILASQEPALQASGVVVQLIPMRPPAVQQSPSAVQGTAGTWPGGRFPHIAVSKVYVSVGRSKVSLVMSELMSPHPTSPRAAITEVVALSARGFMVTMLTPPRACRRRSRDRACATPQRRPSVRAARRLRRAPPPRARAPVRPRSPRSVAPPGGAGA